MTFERILLTIITLAVCVTAARVEMFSQQANQDRTERDAYVAERQSASADKAAKARTAELEELFTGSATQYRETMLATKYSADLTAAGIDIHKLAELQEQNKKAGTRIVPIK